MPRVKLAAFPSHDGPPLPAVVTPMMITPMSIVPITADVDPRNDHHSLARKNRKVGARF